MTDLTPAVNSNDHIYNNINAPLELVEYGDYECPYCGRAYPIVKNIQEKLGQDLKFIFRNFPLRKIHPHAYPAAVATEAAARQGKFWEMHDIIFENQKTLEPENILVFANSLGLDIERFQKDILDESLYIKARKDFESGMRSGVNRTPTFFINGEKYNGSWEENEFLQYLKGQLAEISIS
ncbi:MAG: thioredoxin domain-containing protein [Chitinophagaceae bacterium]|nr:thioredoxin domain-containing protein [Chitinophagaceae bacterium]